MQTLHNHELKLKTYHSGFFNVQIVILIFPTSQEELNSGGCDRKNKHVQVVDGHMTSLLCQILQ